MKSDWRRILAMLLPVLTTGAGCLQMIPDRQPGEGEAEGEDQPQKEGEGLPAEGEAEGHGTPVLPIEGEGEGAQGEGEGAQGEGEGEGCLTLHPAEVECGSVLIGQGTDRTVSISNCGEQEGLLTRIELIDDEDSAFTIAWVRGLMACEPGTRSCLAEQRLLPGQSVEIRVRYTPSAEGAATATLRLTTTIPGQELLVVPLAGRGVTPGCPRAVAEARLAHTEAWGVHGTPAEPLIARPLATLELRGEGSQGAGWAIAGYRWTVLTRPEDSMAQLTPGETVANPTIFLDLAGDFAFELEVLDEQGQVSCQPARIYVSVSGCCAVHLQLVWRTPEDPDLDDHGFGAGADLDLHLRHPLAHDWFELPYDCYYRNPNPNWGRPSEFTDDPSVDRDDTDGWGPENINLDHPEDDRRYRIGVHYFNDHGWGPSLATVRLFLDGILALELTDRRLAATDYFWDVAEFHWPSREVRLIDQILASAPGQGR